MNAMIDKRAAGCLDYSLARDTINHVGFNSPLAREGI